MGYLVISAAVFLFLYLIDKNRLKTKEVNNQNPFGKEFKILIDTLAENLWEGQNFILMKKNQRQYFIQKSKLPYNESHIFLIYRQKSIHLDYYEKVAGVELTYKKTYSLSEKNAKMQKSIANDFSNNVRLYGEIKF